MILGGVGCGNHDRDSRTYSIQTKKASRRKPLLLSIYEKYFLEEVTEVNSNSCTVVISCSC